MSNLIGKIVYTVEAKTNKIHPWRCDDMLASNKEPLCMLSGSRGTCVLPVRCVYATRKEAREVARKNFNQS